MTNDLERRVLEHKNGALDGFTKRYNIKRLVYYEEHQRVLDAIAREKQVKSWRREKKVELIELFNPEWDDVADGWYTVRRDSSLRSE